jgi:hypothetical protein
MHAYLPGDVIFVDAANATADQLAYINSANNAIIKVDSVYLHSSRNYPDHPHPG